VSNEIRIGSSLYCSNGEFKLPQHGGTYQDDQTGEGGGVPGNVVATTGGVDVSFVGLTTPGWVWMKNLDGTNYVQWGPKSGSNFYPIGRMKAGKPAGPFYIEPGTTLHLKANSASCLVQIVSLEA